MPGRERSTGGGKLARSETVTVRLDPKLRYLAELAALKHRRTLSSFIEWAIEDSLQRVRLREGSGYNSDTGTTVSDEGESLWDVDDADRFAKLALKYPELLTHEEQKRWKLIRENGYLWRGRWASQEKWEWNVKEESLILERLREHWDQFCAVARGESEVSVLPTWAQKKPANEKTDSQRGEEFDDDIPF
jgi:hypothetical protein